MQSTPNDCAERRHTEQCAENMNVEKVSSETAIEMLVSDWSAERERRRRKIVGKNQYLQKSSELS